MQRFSSFCILLFFGHFVKTPYCHCNTRKYSHSPEMCFYSHDIVTWRPISSQRPKFAQATMKKVLQIVFSMWSASCPLLGNGSLNTFPQKQTRGTIGHLLLGNGAVNRLYQQYRMCFLWIYLDTI
jgi:hypothetical protein